jgi:hypothetical protein
VDHERLSARWCRGRVAGGHARIAGSAGSVAATGRTAPATRGGAGLLPVVGSVRSTR